MREAAYAWQLERDPGGWSKQKILQEYLNTIYFGNGAYGVQQAALVYFQHGAKDLTLAESALLAGIPADPTRYDPVTNPRPPRRGASSSRRCSRSRRSRRRSYEEADATALPDPDDVRLPGTEGPAQHFVNYVKQQLIDEYGQTEVFGGGLKVRTTIDLELQQAARDAISKWLTEPTAPRPRSSRSTPRRRRPRDDRRQQLPQEPVQPRRPGRPPARLVLQAVRARDRAPRQGISPATHFQSEPQSIDLGDKDWVVGNYDDVYYGNVDLETATIESDNSVYAQLTQLVGSKKVAETGEAPRDPEQARRLLRDRARRRGGDAARARARLRHPRPRRPPRRRDDLRQPAAGDRGGDPRRPEAPQHAEGVHALTATQAGVVNSDPAEGRPLRHRQARLPPEPAGRGQDRHDGELRRRLVRRLHAAARGRGLGRLPDDAEADADRVPRRARHRRQLPGPDLEVVHGEGAQGRGAGGLPGAGTAVRRAEARRPPRRPAHARQRPLPRTAEEVVYFAGTGPSKTANCLENEVQVPDVRKLTLAEAQARVEAQPLTPELVYKPAEPLQRPGIVVDQDPRRGYRSSYDRIILIVTKATQGVIPNLVGRDVADARLRLKRLKLEPRITWVERRVGHGARAEDARRARRRARRQGRARGIARAGDRSGRLSQPSPPRRSARAPRRRR